MAFHCENQLDTAAVYDRMAAAYAARSANGPYSALYERPALQSLLPPLAGKHLLDVGCGAGPLLAWALDQGAGVTGIDICAGLIALARRALGPRAALHVHDAAQPLDFLADGSVDVVTAELSLHYLADWVGPLREFRRILSRDGIVVFSTHHPALDWRLADTLNYHATQIIVETWDFGGTTYQVRFYRRPLAAMFEAFAAAHFVVDRLCEPAPGDFVRANHPEMGARLAHRPWFLFFRLRQDTAAPGSVA